MFNKIKDIISFRGNAQADYCQKVVGSMDKVNEIANFYRENADVMEVIVLNGLLELNEGAIVKEDKTTINSFNKEEYEMFRRGAKYLVEFMAECLLTQHERSKQVRVQD